MTIFPIITLGLHGCVVSLPHQEWDSVWSLNLNLWPPSLDFAIFVSVFRLVSHSSVRHIRPLVISRSAPHVPLFVQTRSLSLCSPFSHPLTMIVTCFFLFFGDQALILLVIWCTLICRSPICSVCSVVDFKPSAVRGFTPSAQRHNVNTCVRSVCCRCFLYIFCHVLLMCACVACFLPIEAY